MFSFSVFCYIIDVSIRKWLHGLFCGEISLGLKNDNLKNKGKEANLYCVPKLRLGWVEVEVIYLCWPCQAMRPHNQHPQCTV